SPDLERLSTPRSRLRGDPGSPTPRNLRFRGDPGSALLACVLHEYACSGVPHPTKPTGFAGTPSRRPGRIRTTAGYSARQGWVATPDFSAPFLNSLLAALPPTDHASSDGERASRSQTPRARTRLCPHRGHPGSSARGDRRRDRVSAQPRLDVRRQGLPHGWSRRPARARCVPAITAADVHLSTF